jgi:hypothetical protein
MTWTGLDGLRVETVRRSLSGTQDGDWLLATRPVTAFGGGRLYVGQARTPAGLAALGIDLASLTEAES